MTNDAPRAAAEADAGSGARAAASSAASPRQPAIGRLSMLWTVRPAVARSDTEPMTARAARAAIGGPRRGSHRNFLKTWTSSGCLFAAGGGGGRGGPRRRLFRPYYGGGVPPARKPKKQRGAETRGIRATHASPHAH